MELPVPRSSLILTCPEPKCPLPCSVVNPPLEGGYLSHEGGCLCGKRFDSFECTSLSSTRRVASSIKVEVFIGCVLPVVFMCGEGGQGGGEGEYREGRGVSVSEPTSSHTEHSMSRSSHCLEQLGVGEPVKSLMLSPIATEFIISALQSLRVIVWKSEAVTSTGEGVAIW